MPIAPFRPPRRVNEEANKPCHSPKRVNTTASTFPVQLKKSFPVQWRKKSNKKNKTWEGDGVVVISGDFALLKLEKKILSRGKANCVQGTEFVIGGYEVLPDSTDTTEVTEVLPEGSTEGHSFHHSEVVKSKNTGGSTEGPKLQSSSGNPSALPSGLNRQFKPPKRSFHQLNEHSEGQPPDSNGGLSSSFEDTTECDGPSGLKRNCSLLLEKNSTVEDMESLPSSFEGPNGPSDSKSSEVKASPVLKIAEAKATFEGNSISKVPSEFKKSPVVGENPPVVGNSGPKGPSAKGPSELRPHQITAHNFISTCFNSHGCLLADDMGLGKTLTAISVIWTFLQTKKAKKVLICCPVTLTDNWRKEFAKWLDMNKIGILCLNSSNLKTTDKRHISAFLSTNVYQVAIMGYEKVLAYKDDLSPLALRQKIDILVCDEGHRLKNASGKILRALTELSVVKTLVMTGTPIQNDLNEFFTLANFVYPGVFGDAATFAKNYIRPITASRDITCRDQKVLQKGREMSMRLIETSKLFMLRRTKEILEKHLPCRTDLILFCPPTELQRDLLKSVTGSARFDNLLNNDALGLITICRKICNSPSLIREDSLFQKICGGIPGANRIAGSKINVLVPLLLEFRARDEKAVIVSNFTQTLDVLNEVSQKLNIRTSRLDGTINGSKRDSIVTQFNKSRDFQVFLLSAKAGGTGLNLIGASRLILFDNDWNPATDIQAMARIHRDGQKKPVFIYRLLTTGCIDEKIFQRQLMKTNLSDMFLDKCQDSSLDIFDFQDLRDLFTVTEYTESSTHDLIECCCDGKANLSDHRFSDHKFSDHSSSDHNSSDHNSSDQFSDQFSDHKFSDGFTTALQALDDKNIAKKETIRSALTKYSHFRKGNKGTGDEIVDGLLDQNWVTFVFTSSGEDLAEG